MENQNYIPSEPLVGLKRTKKIVSSILILIILLAVGWFLYSYLQKPAINNALPEGYVINDRKMLPDGFPLELFFEKDKSLWQRSEDTLTGFGERVRIIEAIYEDAGETFVSDFKKHIESLGWTQTVSDGSDKTTYAIYEMNGSKFILTVTDIDSGLFVNMTYTTYVSN